MGGARWPGNDDGGFGSWRPGTGSEHGLEKSSGARERRNRRLGLLVTGARQWHETMMSHEWWREEHRRRWLRERRKCVFLLPLVTTRIRMDGKMMGSAHVGRCGRNSGRRRGRVLGRVHARRWALAIFCVGLRPDCCSLGQFLGVLGYTIHRD
jgi:hypothetical protein